MNCYYRNKNGKRSVHVFPFLNGAYMMRSFNIQLGNQNQKMKKLFILFIMIQKTK